MQLSDQNVKKKNGNGHVVDHFFNSPLPSNTEAEASLLSAIIINNSVLKQIDDFNPSYFYKPAHQIIASSIVSLTNRAIPADLVTLVHDLREKGKLEEVGGASYLAMLIDCVPLAVNAPHYYNIVKESSIKRNDIEKANYIIQGSLTGSASASEISRLKQELINNSFSNGIESFTAADLEKEILPDPVWVVPGVIPEGLSILGGKPKKGKSILALNVALSVASGSTALGSVEITEPSNVLYLSLEDKKKRLKTRISAIVGHEGWSENIHFYTAFPRMGNGGIESLEKEINNHNAKFVVIDTLAKFRPVSGREVRNMYLDDYSYMSEIRELSAKTGCSILVIHHLRKSSAADSGDIFDCFSGSNGITGSVDCMLALTRTKGALNSILSVSGNDVGDQDYALDYDQVNFHWSLLGESSQVQNSDQKQVLYDLFSDNPDEVFTPKQLIELTGLNYSYIRKTLPQLVKDGVIRKTGRGMYKCDDGINIEQCSLPHDDNTLTVIDPVDPIDPDNEKTENDDSGINGNNGIKDNDTPVITEICNCSPDCSIGDNRNKNDDSGINQNGNINRTAIQVEPIIFRSGNYICPGGYVYENEEHFRVECNDCREEKQFSEECPFNDQKLEG